MNWIRIALGIKNDPDVARIAGACKVRVSESVGLVVSLLIELPEHAIDGHIAQVPDILLERWAGWEGKRGVFAAAFRQHLCEDGTVRSWEKHNGAAIRESNASRDRMKSTREAKRSAPKPPPEPEPSAERSPNVRRTVPRTFASDVTGRDVTTTPSKPDGLDGPPSPPGPNATAGPLFAEWEQQLREVALPHEVAALEHVAAAGFRPTIVGELYAIASGQHVVRSRFDGDRIADAADVMRSLSEFACLGRPWDQSYFRGVVRRVIERPPEPPDAAARAEAALAQQVATVAPTPALRIADLSAEEREASRLRREAAMAHFKAEFSRNNPAGATDPLDDKRERFREQLLASPTTTAA